MPCDIHAELKALRLHGMAAAWEDILEQGGSASVNASKWLIEHLLDAEDRVRIYPVLLLLD